MRILILPLLLLSILSYGQRTIVKPSDLRMDTILIHINSFEETIGLLTKEYERSNIESQCKERIAELKLYHHNSLGQIPNDIYALEVNESIINWMNESLIKLCQKTYSHFFQVVDSHTIRQYPTDQWKYVLRYDYFFEDGNPIEAKMFFYFQDRQQDLNLYDYNDLKKADFYYPFFLATADKIYPYYSPIRSGRVKKDWRELFENL